MHISDGLFDGVFGRGAVDTSDRAWLQAMLDTEAALARALEEAGMAAPGAGAAVTDAAQVSAFDAAELGRQAALTGNPVPALVRELSRMLPPGAAAAVHQGATSQDIIDTAAMLLAKQAMAVVTADLAGAAAAAARLAAAHRDTVMIGRTLLQQAVPVTFGLVAAGWLTGLDEARAALARVAATRLAVQFGGAAGTLAPLGGNGPEIAALLAAELGLPAPTLPWHTDRLRVTEIGGACAGVTGVLGKIARDVTLLAQSEVGEVRAGGDAGGRGGSSAMPHKRNPVAAIAVLGCTRQVPGLLATLAAAAEHEQQRAAGAWHAEWEPFSDLLRLTGSAASWGAELLTGLEADPARMRDNLDAAGGFPMAEHVASILTPALGRVAAHDLLAQASARAVAEGRTLRDVLLDSPDAARLAEAGVTAGQVDEALDPAGYLGAAGDFVDAALGAHRGAEQADSARVATSPGAATAERPHR
ncbi:MAG TPA: 3-carboxy-cis,cis-muconate cycloisomerase [Streptosporangiaceae bacterium]|nr:3-carboxy-cis,cis-muconate cycloisomerase [Streptosporangiaceae bacterium]